MPRRVVLLVIGLLVVVAGWAYTQSVPRATADMQLAWDQQAPALADAQAYRYTAYVDGSATGTVVAATCSGAASPFTCVTPLPVTALGDHTVVVAAQTALGESEWSAEARSESFTFRVVEPASSPFRLRLMR